MKKYIRLTVKAAILALSLGTMCHADTTTTRTGMVKPTIGSPSWGPKINGNFDIADSSFAVQNATNTYTSTNVYMWQVKVANGMLYLYDPTALSYANIMLATFASTRTYTIPDAGGDASVALDGNGLTSTLHSSYTFTGTVHASSAVISAVTVSTLTLNNIVKDNAGNTFLRYTALDSPFPGAGTIALGRNTCAFNSGQYADLCIGEYAGRFITTGGENTAVGVAALTFTTTGVDNTAVGYQALNQNTANYNTAVGNAAGNAITTGQGNVCVGLNSCTGIDTSSANVTGSNNVYVGYEASPGTDEQLDNATCVGSNCKAISSNTVQLGGNGVYSAAQNLLWYGDLRPNDIPGTYGQTLVSGGQNVSPFWTASGTTTLQAEINTLGQSTQTIVNNYFPVSLSTGVTGVLNIASGTISNFTAQSSTMNTVNVSTASVKSLYFGDGSRQTTAATGGTGGGVSVYPATATASFPFGLTASTMTASTFTLVNISSIPTVISGIASHDVLFSSYGIVTGNTQLQFSPHGGFLSVRGSSDPVDGPPNAGVLEVKSSDGAGEVDLIAATNGNSQLTAETGSLLLTNTGATNGVSIDSSPSANPTVHIVGGLDAGSNLISNVTDPSNPQDAATKNYVDTANGAPFLPLAGGTMAGTIDMSGNFIVNLATPTNPADAANKSYVDSKGPYGGDNVIQVSDGAGTLTRSSDHFTYRGDNGNTQSEVRLTANDQTAMFKTSAENNYFVATSSSDPDNITAFVQIDSGAVGGQILMHSNPDGAELSLDNFGAHLTVNPATQAFDMGGSRIISVGDPTGPQDAATKNYVDTVNAAVVSAASAGGADNEELTVSGLLTTSTIYAVSAASPGGNVVNSAIVGFSNDLNGSLHVFWIADPGAGATVLVYFKP